MIRRLISSALLALALALPALAEDTWTIDAAHTNAGFAVRHMMVSTTRGHFKKVEGKITYDGKSLSSLKVEATIDAASIDTGVEKRDEHLRSADFFDVAKHPTLTFASKKVEAGESGKFKMTGDLTIHGVVKEVVFDVEGPTPTAKDPHGNTRIGASATTKIKRSDFGLTYNAVIEAGGVAIGDEITITLEVEAILEKPAEKKETPAGAKPAK